MNWRPELNDETKPIPIWGWVQDRLYDTVFHVGDTTQQFLWDMMQGPENDRHSQYIERQTNRQSRRGQKPLSGDDQRLFAELTRRQPGERLTDHWKRRKTLLATPDKLSIINSYRQLKSQKEELAQRSNRTSNDALRKEIEAEFREIQSLKYAQKQASGQKMGSR